MTKKITLDLTEELRALTRRIKKLSAVIRPMEYVVPLTEDEAAGANQLSESIEEHDNRIQVGDLVRYTFRDLVIHFICGGVGEANYSGKNAGLYDREFCKKVTDPKEIELIKPMLEDK